MPTGFWDSLNPAARFLEWMQPKRVLDVGIGNGRMGFLAREYGNKEGIPRWKPGVQTVDGIEGYAPYIGQLQEAIYDRILVGDALELLHDLTGQYELVIASDVLEHFVRTDGALFLQLAMAAGDVVLISTPNFDMAQESEANPLENHRSFWPGEDLRGSGARYFEPGPLSNFALFGQRATIDAYAKEVEHPVTWKDWLLPPEVKRLLRQQRSRIRA